MLRLGGTFRRDEIPGVLTEKFPLSLSLPWSGPSPLADCCCRRASIMCLCCSRTLMLRWSCSFIKGSWVTKPGERHANPTSWMPSPSLAVKGRPVAGPAALDPPLDRSNLPGRLRGA